MAKCLNCEKAGESEKSNSDARSLKKGVSGLYAVKSGATSIPETTMSIVLKFEAPFRFHDFVVRTRLGF